MEDGEPAIRYAVIRRKDERIILAIYASFETPHENFYDVGEFRSVLPDDDPEEIYFGTPEEAISFLVSRKGGSAERFVNQGLIDEEYKDYRIAKQ
jgi:hypothetical protein